MDSIDPYSIFKDHTEKSSFQYEFDKTIKPRYPESIENNTNLQIEPTKEEFDQITKLIQWCI